MSDELMVKISQREYERLVKKGYLYESVLCEFNYLLNTATYDKYDKGLNVQSNTEELLKKFMFDEYTEKLEKLKNEYEEKEKEKNNG